ncbi:MAG: hypothetical protein R3208_21910, partial [Ketobacteraceae bacterium]|nr:hypothetical protein [Ketobacteraceae bacterium]
MGLSGHLGNHRSLLWLTVFGIVLQLTAARAFAYQPDIANAIPEQLKPWQDWVLQQQPGHQCPFKAGQFGERHCVWPAALTITAGANSAHFQLIAHSYSAGWIMLPGGDGFWPHQISVNNEPAESVAVGGRPAVYLDAGQYLVEGTIPWQRLPERLQIPRNTGLVALSVNGRTVAMPRREASGQLWLIEQTTDPTTDTEDKLGLSVFRHLKDGVPFQVTTEVRLEVSGRPREAFLGTVLLPEFELLAVDSPLPARVEEDGRLRIRLRSGSWTLQVQGRRSDHVQSLPLPEVDAVWPSEELWSFEPRSEFRQVRIEGAESVDPGQTRIPDNWKRWKAYRIIPGQVLKLITVRRGDPEPAPNRLHLNREAWIAFAGDGMTFRDQINGSLSRHWRLNAKPGYRLGHVSSHGEPNVVTVLDGNLGVELRNTSVSLEAVGEVAGTLSRKTELSATGWQQDFEHVSVDLNMPPGWRLFAATGADHVQNAWLNRWQVWDLFLLLITVAALVKLRGIAVGLISGVAFFLIYPEQPGILWLWLNMMAVFALLSVLKSGAFSRIMVFYGRFSALALVAACLPFLVSQARTALYPQLEQGYYATAAPAYHQDPSIDFQQDTHRPERRAKAPAVATLAMESSAAPREMQGAAVAKSGAYDDSRYMAAIDPNTAAQTGPSVPAWHWNLARMGWSGPVTSEQSVTLYFLKPADSRIAAALRVVLLIVIAIGLFRGWRTGLGLKGGHLAGLFGLLPVALVLFSMAPPAVAAATIEPHSAGSTPVPADESGFPPARLLDELQSRLLKARDCSPNCVAANGGRLQLVEGRLDLIIEYHALEAVQVLLPQADNQWMPDAITLDGEAAPVREENNRLWAALKPGTQRLKMSGTVSGNEALQLSFPEPVYNLSVSAPGWIVKGMDNGRISGGALTLEPLNAAQQRAETDDRFPPNTIEPFVRVERFLRLGLNWYVETRVNRMAPEQGAIKLKVPLISGESVTTQNVSVEDGKVAVVLNPHQHQFQWFSSLDKTGQIHLNAPENVPWVERWHLEAARL